MKKIILLTFLFLNISANATTVEELSRVIETNLLESSHLVEDAIDINSNELSSFSLDEIVFGATIATELQIPFLASAEVAIDLELVWSR
jgi:hypothetical protein